MALVEQDQVEKIRRQSSQPAIFFTTLELADIRDDDVRFIEIGTVGRSASNFDGLGIRAAREHVALLIEHVAVGWIKVSDQLPGDRNSSGNDESPIGTKGKGCEGDASGFPATDGQHNADLAFIVSRCLSVIA